MNYNITNISGGLLVYDLLNGNTLRLNNRQCKTLKETEVDSKILKHLETLSLKGLILLEKVKVQEHKEKKEVKKENPKVNENESKEEK